MFEITVVVPVYQNRDRVARTIRSVLAQPDIDARVIAVIDDQCRDTLAIVEQLGVEAVFNERNMGAPWCRNRGLALTTSPYVMFLDSDDYLEGNLLAGLCRRMDETGADIAIGQTLCEFDDGRWRREIPLPRETGAAIRLIGDGDVAGVIHTTDPEETGIDIYLGIGGAPEGVLAASALRCTGGQMQGRLVLDTDEKIARAAKMGISDPKRKYQESDMARGDVLFAATGVTDGNLLSGVKFGRVAIKTHTIVMRSSSGTVREIIRLVQEARKAQGFEVTDRIELWWEAGGDAAAALRAAREALAEEVLAVSVTEGAPAAPLSPHDTGERGVRFWLRAVG